MRPLPNESYEQWAERVNLFEKGRAMQRIAKGDDPEIVLEDMSRRIIDKLLHSIFTSIRESIKSDYDPAKNKAEYEKIMQYHSPVADHVDGNLFDKSE
jgi:glutamyl-tRNA reductase